MPRTVAPSHRQSGGRTLQRCGVNPSDKDEDLEPHIGVRKSMPCKVKDKMLVDDATGLCKDKASKQGASTSFPCVSMTMRQ